MKTTRGLRPFRALCCLDQSGADMHTVRMSGHRYHPSSMGNYCGTFDHTIIMSKAFDHRKSPNTKDLESMPVMLSDEDLYIAAADSTSPDLVLALPPVRSPHTHMQH